VNRRSEQFALRAGLAVDDHAQPGEDAAQRDHEPDGPNAGERLVIDRRMQAAGRDLQRGCDDQRDQGRAK
jgi:hypothetical protein